MQFCIITDRQLAIIVSISAWINFHGVTYNWHWLTDHWHYSYPGCAETNILSMTKSWTVKLCNLRVKNFILHLNSLAHLRSRWKNLCGTNLAGAYLRRANLFGPTYTSRRLICSARMRWKEGFPEQEEKEMVDFVNKNSGINS